MAKVKPTEKSIKVRRADVDSICIYSVTEDELDILEKGSPSSLYLNFSLFLLSAALSFSAAAILTPPQDIYIFSVFIIIIFLGFILGVIFLIMWHRNSKSSKSIAGRIRSRLKEETGPTEATEDSVKPREKATRGWFR